MEKNLESIINYLLAISNAKNLRISKREIEFIIK